MRPHAKPVAKIRYSFAGGNVTTASWVEISSSLPAACSEVEIFNGSGSILLIATGALGAEVEIPYTIRPNGSFVLLPLNLAKGVRVAVKALDNTAADNYLLLSFFG